MQFDRARHKTKEEREKILRKLSGIKEPPKKKEKEKKPPRAPTKPRCASNRGMQLIRSMRPQKRKRNTQPRGSLLLQSPTQKHAAHAISR